MGNCYICQNEMPDRELLCNHCGYDSKSNKISDFDLCRSYFATIKSKKNCHWSERVEFLDRLYRTLKCEQKHLCRLFNISPAKVSGDLRAARILKEDPTLKDMSSKMTAVRFFNSIRSTRSFKSEDELQKFLYKNWEKIPLSKNWSLVGIGNYGKQPACDLGEMDFLAQNKKRNKWLVIELKVGQSSDETVGQILRYMGWVKKNKAQKNDKVIGIILSDGQNEKIQSALVCIKPIVNALIFRITKEGLARLFSYKKAKIIDQLLIFKSELDKLPRKTRIRIIKEYLKQH